MNANSRVDSAALATYLDSSAVVKLVVPEAESAGLLTFLQSRTKLVSSVLAEIEVARAIRRATLSDVALARAREVLDALWLVNLSHAIRSAAATLDPPVVRSLDAIHLATALSLGPELDVFVAYDRGLAKVARAAGMRVASPR